LCLTALYVFYVLYYILAYIQHDGDASLVNLSTQVQPLIKICNTGRVVNFLKLIDPDLFKVKIVVSPPI
jgi:hypothetical protein